MRLALAQGADGIELDVRLCGSGEAVVLHDPDLLRVAGVAYEVMNLSRDELQRCELGGGERVPLLDEALELVLGGGALLNIELKPDVPDSVALIRAVSACVQRRAQPERERILLSSFSRSLCRMASAALPGLAIAALIDKADAALPDGIRAVHPHQALATSEAIARWHHAGLRVNVWTVNDPARARELANHEVDAIITDDVPTTLAALSTPT